MSQCIKVVITVILIVWSLPAMTACSGSSTAVPTSAVEGHPPTITPNPYAAAGPTNSQS